MVSGDDADRLIIEVAVEIQSLTAKIEVVENQIFETQGLLGHGFLANRLLLEIQNRALFEDYLDRLVKLILTIASDDLDNFKDLTSQDPNAFSLRPLLIFISKYPSTFRKQLGELLTREFTDKVVQNEVASYDALREVFGPQLTH
jgi:hypothetical protein